MLFFISTNNRAVAQGLARLVRDQKVAGSIPACPTLQKILFYGRFIQNMHLRYLRCCFFVFLFRKRFHAILLVPQKGGTAMKNREEKIMAWGEAKLLHHLRNFKRSKWAFKDYAYAFRMLRKFFKMNIQKDCQKAV